MQATTEQTVTGLKNSQPTGAELDGFSLILLDGKKPIEKDWQQHCTKKRSLPLERLNGQNVGIACGPASGCIVLDIDNPQVFRKTCEKNGWTVPETRTHETGRGMPHYLFKYPQDGSDYGNKTCASMGFDIRGKGGQVVAPGSVHPDTGKRYRVVRDIPMAPAPQWLLDLYKKKTKPADGGLIGAPNKYGATALANELTALSCTPKGVRNDQLNRSAHALGQLVAGGEIEQCQVEQALTAAALGIGLAPNEVKTTIASGMASGMTSPRKAPETIPANGPKAGINSQKKKPPKKSAVNLICASKIKPEPVAWVWDGYLARGKVHIIAGPPGHGKTTLLLGLLAILTIGGRWPDGTRAEACDVAIWSGEDDPADTLIPRLLACGADLRRVHIVRGVTEDGEKRSFDPSTDISLLRESIQSKKIKLLVIDPIVSAVGGDSHKNAETRRALQPIVDLAADFDCAVYGVTHFTKGTVGRDPVERVTGSLAFGAVTRVVTVAMKLPGNGEHPDGARLFARAKSNIGPDGGGFYYFLQVGEVPGYEDMFNTRVLWGDELDGTAKDLIAKAEVFGSDQGATGEAAAWLAEFLSEGPVLAVEVIKAASKMGFSRTTLQRAKDRLRIKSSKVGFARGWEWILPKQADEESAKVPHTGNTESSGQNSMQVIDSVEDSAKVPKTRNLRSNATWEEHEDSKGSESSDGATVGAGLGGVETTKIPHSTVLESSEPVGIFERDGEPQQSDLWEIEI